MDLFSATNVLCAFIICTLLSFAIKRCFKVMLFADKIDKIPGPPALPLIGNAFEFSAKGSDVPKRVAKRFQTYGPICRLWLGSKPLVSLSTAEQAEVILSSSKHLEKNIFYSHLEGWLGEGLLLAKGSRWHAHRKMLTPTFHFKILEAFQEVIVSKCNILVDKLSEYVESGDAFELFAPISLATLDIICETALGVDIKAQEAAQSDYVKSINEITAAISVRNRFLWLHPDFIFKNTHYGKTFEKCLNVLQNFTKEIIAERKSHKETDLFSSSSFTNKNDLGIKRRVALLDLLLEGEIDEKAICEEVDTFTFEGHDTTSTGVSFTLFLLGHHPEIQQKAYEELYEIFAGEDRPVTLADLGEMKLLDRVVKESLRLYPPVPVIGRLLEEDVVIDGYEIPSRVDVGIIIYLLHRDPSHFPDPEKFDPNRFLPENTKDRHPFAYIPFSAGSRNCIGQKFAMYEEKTILASILRKYKIKSVNKREDLKICFDLVLRSEEGFKVKLEKR